MYRACHPQEEEVAAAAADDDDTADILQENRSLF